MKCGGGRKRKITLSYHLAQSPYFRAEFLSLGTIDIWG